ncbi:hypothetical protein [Sutcliffiella horikoshii]|uniref:hypothetical protein n=1 Tax=Sutcliffiella horikoshii TaxID=79883 RepID=UPI00165345C5|nr:hypothetical protein [Sutcliffiella horikoshii]
MDANEYKAYVEKKIVERGQDYFHDVLIEELREIRRDLAEYNEKMGHNVEKS